ncbi:MAG: methyltransferase domain-containing protein [Saprospiraceae bacterium]
MNFKFYFPTFRNRYLFVRQKMAELARNQSFERGLNLGTGEGDYDKMIAGYVGDLVGVDVNADDLAHAREVNRGVMNLRYQVGDALALSFADASFDLIVSCEVIEHVGQPEKMVQEMGRVLRPGGVAVMTFPSREFPFTYDPVNRIGQWLGRKPPRENVISQGAYAFGHEYLIGSEDFKKWAERAGFQVVEFRNLSGHLVGLLEVYWTGIVQKIFKKNTQNVATDEEGDMKMRPSSTNEPPGVFLTDAVIWLDRLLFGAASRSIGKGVVLRKLIR